MSVFCCVGTSSRQTFPKETATKSLQTSNMTGVLHDSRIILNCLADFKFSVLVKQNIDVTVQSGPGEKCMRGSRVDRVLVHLPH